MSQSNAPLSNDILRALDLIRSTDPQERKRAVSILSAVRGDPRVQQVFEHLYAKDPDPGVRHAAWQALQQSEPAIPAPGSGAAPPRTAPPAPRQRRPSTMVRRRAGRRGMFLINPANAQLVNRESKRAAKRKQGGRSALVLASVLLLVVGLLWGMVLPDWVTAWRLDRDGEDVSGQVTGRQVSGENHYSVQYRFEVEQNGEKVRFTGSQPVTQKDFEQMDTGSRVTVTYVQDNESISRLGQRNPDHDLRNRLTIAAAGLSAVALLVLILGLLQSTRPYLLRGGWRLIRGQVTACQGRVDDDGDYKIVLRYQFRSPSKRVITTQVRQIRNDLRKAPLPRPGSPVAVYYRSDKKYRML